MSDEIRDLPDGQLLDLLREEWQRRDPVPADLAELALLAIGVADLDLELMLLEGEVLSLGGARGGAGDSGGEPSGTEGTRTLTFTGGGLSLTVTVTPSRRGRFRLDGWVAPLAGGQVRAHHATARDAEADVDREGRFVLADVAAGLVQIVYHPAQAGPAAGPLDAAARGPVDRGAGPVPRPVAAPPVRL